MDKVSIVIPAYNSQKWISDAISSALSQSYKNIEVVVVNDGSEDDTEKEILKFKDRIKYIKQKNQGLSEARNTGIRASSGKFIVPLDADDKLAENFVSELMPFMEKYDFVSTWVHAFGDIDQIWRFGPYDPIKHLRGEINLCYCALYKKSVWEKVGGYKKIMAKNGAQGFEDYEFWLSVWENGFLGYVLEKPLFFYRKHGYSMINEAQENKKELGKIIRNLHKDLFDKYAKK